MAALVRRQTPVAKLGVKSQPGACQCGHKLWEVMVRLWVMQGAALRGYETCFHEVLVAMSSTALREIENLFESDTRLSPSELQAARISRT